MKNIFIILFISFPIIANCQQSALSGEHVYNHSFVLSDFYNIKNEKLNHKVDSVFKTLTDEERIGQMFVQAGGKLGVPEKELTQLILKKQIGGILLLKGNKDEFKRLIIKYDSLNKRANGIPLFYSGDGEPSLINKKIDGIQKITKSSEIRNTEEADSIASVIASIFREIGLHVNYAPLCDVAFNKDIIKNRSFSNLPEKVKDLSLAFTKSLQSNGIVATAKHFPGHGQVIGDSHKESVFIDGDLNELEIYHPLIKNNIISIMIGHISIVNNAKYNTDSLPSTVSRKIITGLLRNEMGFQGIIVTDGMRMKAVSSIKDAAYESIKAGVDQVLIPYNIQHTIQLIAAEIKKNENFRNQIYESVMRIIRLKICLGLIK